ncbi:hypothetical protein OC842_004826 [Tilletia horrida]|uniref:Small ribosomal subunit protein bS18m n=1 Tax=Tilletia horrida TaxID=155126 RepID=A0AAN6GAA9_9BASI|nr:hypothetical protein OC842_004826 [Tilletia horrida]
MASALPALSQRMGALALSASSSARAASVSVVAGLPASRALSTSARLLQDQQQQPQQQQQQQQQQRRPQQQGRSPAAAFGQRKPVRNAAPSSSSGPSTPSSSQSPPSPPADAAQGAPRKELFSVYTPSSRAEHTIAQRAAAAPAIGNKKPVSGAAAGESAAAAAGADADAEDGADAPTAAAAAQFTAAPTGPKVNRRFLHGQLVAPSAFTPLSSLRPSASADGDSSPSSSSGSSRSRARPLLGPSAALAKRLDPFYKLGLNPAKPTLADDSYKNGSMLAPFVSDLGRILPRSRTGLTRKGQRQVGKAVRRARSMGLLPVFNRGTGKTSGYAWR